MKKILSIFFTIALLICLVACEETSITEKIFLQRSHEHSFSITGEGKLLCDCGELFSDSFIAFVDEDMNILKYAFIKDESLEEFNLVATKDGYEYTNNGTEKIVVIRTSGTKQLTINAPSDSLYHYGEASVVSIKAVKSSSYHENGSVSLIDLTKGRIALEETSEVSHIHFAASEDSEKQFEEIIVAIAESAAVPNFSRDPIKSDISLASNILVAEIQNSTDADSAKAEFIWLCKQGLYEQMKVSSSDSLSEGTVVFADDQTVELNTSLIASEIANSYNGTDDLNTVLDPTTRDYTGNVADVVESGLDEDSKESFVSQIVVPSHKHVFEETYSSNENYHWKACTDSTCSEVSEKRQHTWNENDICTVCGAKHIIFSKWDGTKRQADCVISTMSDITYPEGGTEHRNRIDINSAQGLKYFIEDVNLSDYISINSNHGTGNSSTVAYVFVNCNIDLNNIDWTPVSAYGSCWDFDNHIVRNLKVDKTGNVGFFSVVDYVSNVTFENSSVKTTSSESFSAVIAASGYGFKNCHVLDCSVTGTKYTGAIVGDTNGSANVNFLINCSAKNSTIESTGKEVGGLVGFLYITNDPSAHKISGCTLDNVIVKGSEEVGGIAGRIGTEGTVTIENCVLTDMSVSATVETYLGNYYGRNYGMTINAVNNSFAAI